VVVENNNLTFATPFKTQPMPNVLNFIFFSNGMILFMTKFYIFVGEFKIIFYEDIRD
jgi:hypothetical protein